MTLRPYQQEAHDKIMEWIRRTTQPCMIEAATGAGKSHIIAALAETVHARTGKNVLCLAPSKELVEQNHSKYPGEASLFSASVGIKCLANPVVFGTPLTVLNSIEKFGDEIAMVIVDECHGITPTIKEIIEKIPNPNLRVVGMSATPYRLGTGYIFRQWPDGSAVPLNQTRDPYFTRCVYQIRARELIEQGFLTPPRVGDINAASYNTRHMKLNSMGQFSAADIDRAYNGQGRKTAAIIADIVAQAQSRMGVLIFAATVRHAEECLESLPPELSEIVTGTTPKKEREDILRRFKAQEIKYLVNVSVLTTGFDATHVDVIAMMRGTESVGLMQQIIGRGLRLHPAKQECLVLDYAENIERHCPDGDVFSPKIEAAPLGSDEDLACECPLCMTVNVFKKRPNLAGFSINKNGYFCDEDGFAIAGEYGPIPAHFGRRCQATEFIQNELRSCSYRWTSKECKKCKEPNDIAALYCCKCEAELVDPNEKLRLVFENRKKDPTVVQTDQVLEWSLKPSVSQAGNPTYMARVKTPYRAFSFWIQKHPKHPNARADLNMVVALNGKKPETITYRKNPNTDFYQIFGFNRAHDEAPK